MSICRGDAEHENPLYLRLRGSIRYCHEDCCGSNKDRCVSGRVAFAPVYAEGSTAAPWSLGACGYAVLGFGAEDLRLDPTVVGSH